MARQPHRRTADRLSAAVMLLALLGATLLFSAGSHHHQSHADLSAALTVHDIHVEDCDVASADSPASGHDHQHGTDWVPHLTQRFRAADCSSFVVTLLNTRDNEFTAAVADSLTADPVPTGGDLTLLGVLRV